ANSTDEYEVKVRRGKVISAQCNGQPLQPAQYRYNDMPALMGFIEDFLEQDSQPGRPRTFATATFDPKDGHWLRYSRSVSSTPERQEITVQVRPVGSTGPAVGKSSCKLGRI